MPGGGRPFGGQADGDVEPVLGVVDQEGAGRPRSRRRRHRAHREPCRRRASPRARVSARRRRPAGRCRAGRPAPPVRRTATRPGRPARRRARPRTDRRGCGPARRRPPASESPVGDRQHPVERAAHHRRSEPFATAGRQRGTARQRERDVTAHPCGQDGQLRPTQAGTPQRVAGDERSGRVALRRPSLLRPECPCAGCRRAPVVTPA